MFEIMEHGRQEGTAIIKSASKEVAENSVLLVRLSNKSATEGSNDDQTVKVLEGNEIQ